MKVTGREKESEQKTASDKGVEKWVRRDMSR